MYELKAGSEQWVSTLQRDRVLDKGELGVLVRRIREQLSGTDWRELPSKARGSLAHLPFMTRPRHERQMCKTSPSFARWFHRLFASIST